MEKWMVSINDNEFPNGLKNLYDCPKRLYGVGDKELLNCNKAVTVVGSRQMSRYGEEVIKMIIPTVVDKGWVVLSGMAMGVDAVAQKLTLDCGGTTIAVLASSADVATPRSNEWLYQRIIKQGAVVSEEEFGVGAVRDKFVKRNRLMAAWGKLTIVIEGSEFSGTRTTARMAGEMGRDVATIPGRVGDRGSELPNWLIGQGAIPISNSRDLADLLDSYDIV